MSWSEVLLGRLQAQEAEVARFAEVISDYGTVLERLTEVQIVSQQHSHENRLMRFELMNHDGERVHLLEEENARLRQEQETSRAHGFRQSSPSATHQMMVKELAASKEEVKHLRALLRQERLKQ